MIDEQIERQVKARMDSLNPQDMADQITEAEYDAKFDEWITELDETVIQGEYGYERGEFTVFPNHWHPMYLDGLTPQEAFKRALGPGMR